MTLNKSRHERNILLTIYTAVTVLSTLLISCAATSVTHTGHIDTAHTAMFVPASEYDKAGSEVVAALNSGDRDSFIRAIDKKSLLDRTFRGLPENMHTAKARAMLNASMDEAGTLMTKNLVDNADVKFIHSRLTMGEHRALVRVDMNGRGLSYIDFILAKDGKGQVSIIDWHDYAQGQLYSETLRQALVFVDPDRAVQNAELLDNVPAHRSEIEKFSELAVLSRDGKYTEWLNTYNDLPENLKQSRIVLITRVLVASAAGENEEYLHALRDVSTYLGDDPSLSLMLVDHYLNVKDYNSAHRALDRLSGYTGGDAAIELLRANVCLMEKDYSKSVEYARRAVREDPSFEEAYWTLLAVSVFSQQYDIAVDTLSSLERRFGYAFQPSEIAQISGYETFARSSVFTDWKFGIRP